MEKIIDSDGMDIPIRKINASIQWIDSNQARITLNQTIGAEWFYIELPFNRNNIVVKRSDGLIINSHNAWIENNTLHIIDCGPASMYLVTAKMPTVSNLPPVANLIWSPLNPAPSETIQFNSTSYDEDGYIVNYTWNFGDGNASYEKNPTHAYAKRGNYTVTLTVRDNNGATSVIQKKICVWASWDINHDNKTNVQDLIDIARHWMEKGKPGWIKEDVNRDGVVNILDLIIVARHWTG